MYAPSAAPLAAIVDEARKEAVTRVGRPHAPSASPMLVHAVLTNAMATCRILQRDEATRSGNTFSG